MEENCLILWMKCYTFQFVQGISYGPDLSAPKVMSVLLFCFAFLLVYQLNWYDFAKKCFALVFPIVSKFPFLPKYYNVFFSSFYIHFLLFLHFSPILGAWLVFSFWFSAPNFIHRISNSRANDENWYFQENWNLK